MPYSLTEEFTAVYRMHPLLPDDYTFRSAADNSFIDRTDSYKPQTYTKEGLDWVADNTFLSVVVRHFPELSPALKGVGNAFGTWNSVAR